VLCQYGSRGSSVSIVSGYGLDDRAIEVRSPAEARYFSSNLCVQTGSEAHPASCAMGMEGHFPGDKVLIYDLGIKWGSVVSVTLRPRFIPGQTTPGSHWTAGWVGPRADLDTEDREKSFCLCWGSNLDRLIVQYVVRHYTDWATPAPNRTCY
jgi:hypothetical protein